MLIEHGERFSRFEALTRQGRVLLAVTLRNIRTRFFGHGLGYLVALAWPTVHILSVVLVFSLNGRAPPVGDSMALFVVTGSIPFWSFVYVSRFMMTSLLMTRPLLAFPQVKVLDIMLATALQETLAACCVALIFVALGLAFDINPMPRDPVVAAEAFGAALLLGVGFGFFNGVIALGVPFWVTGYALCVILFWGTSGVMFVADGLPEPLHTFASYNPMLQTVEWMRSAYYEGYGVGMLDKAYTIQFALVTICLGLLLERGIRGHLLAIR